MSKLSYLCGEASSPLLYETIGSRFDKTVEAHPEREALVVRHQDIRWTYREYQEQVDRLAAGLIHLGIKQGDRVGIWAPNCYEWCVTQMATAKMGAIMVCINPAYRTHELEYALNKVECKAVISAEKFKTSEYLHMLMELAPEIASSEPGNISSTRLPHLEMVIRMGEDKTPGMFNFAEVCGLGEDADYQQLTAMGELLQPDDPINIQFTSGTTGSPKGATLTHCNILNNGNQVGYGQNLDHNDRVCVPVPLYHCFGMVMGNLAAINHGATVVFPSDAFEPRSVLEAVETEKCTALYGVPTMFVAVLEHPDFANYDLSSLRTGIMAGALCPVEFMKRAMSDMNMSEVIICYGQTETSPVNHMTAIDAPLEKRVATVGRCGPHQEIKIIDELGKVIERGQKGELCCRGYSVMRGYWNDEEKTRETIDAAGWLHSGDLAIMDDEGYVQIVGRLKDMIIRGGENIYPREIEDFLYSHPAVQDVQVFGVPDEKYGEQVCAWIMLKAGQEATAEDIKAFCKDKIAHFKVPRYVEFVEEFPMTVTGKVQKYKMTEMMMEKLTMEKL